LIYLTLFYTRLPAALCQMMIGRVTGFVPSGEKSPRCLLEGVQHNLHRCTGLDDPGISTHPKRPKEPLHPIRARLYTI